MNPDVIIVGAGPSGLCVATELALAGARVKVLERRSGVVQSRAGTILPRVLGLLDGRGLAETFIERARRIRPNPLFDYHIWGGLEPIHWEHLGERYGYRLVLPQNVTEELLLERAAELGVEVERNAEVTGVRQDADGVEVAYMTPDGERTLGAPWLVGADGGRSRVREAVGIPFAGHDGTFTGIIVDTRFEFPWAGGRRMANNERGWAASFPFSDGEPITRFNIVHAERRGAPQREPVTEDEVRACLRDIFGEDVPFDSIRWASRFTDAMRAVDRMREGRVLLVGEACRIHYPSSGVGMNFCIQDAFNLGWKLAAVVNGHAEAETLDTYSLERMPVMHGLLESVKAQCAMQFDFTPQGVAFKRLFETQMMPMNELNSWIARDLNGLNHPYPSSTGAPALTGHPAPDLDLITAAGETRIGKLLRAGRWLLLDLGASGAYAPDDFAGLPIEVVSATATLVPESARGLRSLLIRPDWYVAWASADPPSLDAARAALRPWFKAVA